MDSTVKMAALSVAKVAKLVDALDLGSSGVTRESSSLSFRNQNDELLANPSQLLATPKVFILLSGSYHASFS